MGRHLVTAVQRRWEAHGRGRQAGRPRRIQRELAEQEGCTVATNCPTQLAAATGTGTARTPWHEEGARTKVRHHRIHRELAEEEGGTAATNCPTQPVVATGTGTARTPRHEQGVRTLAAVEGGLRSQASADGIHQSEALAPAAR